jgi:hypothetical protein
MHAPVSTFEHKGKQYVLAFSAGAACSGPRAATACGCSDRLGTMGRCRRAPVPRNAVTISGGRRARARSADARGRDVENGKRCFAELCRCHGEDGKSGHGAAPSLAA